MLLGSSFSSSISPSCPCFSFILRLISMSPEALEFSYRRGKVNESSPHMLPDCMSVGKRSLFHSICRKLHCLMLPLTEVPIWNPITKVAEVTGYVGGFRPSLPVALIIWIHKHKSRVNTTRRNKTGEAEGKLQCGFFFFFFIFFFSVLTYVNKFEVIMLYTL